MQKSFKALIIPYSKNKGILIQDRSNIKKKIKLNWGYFGGGIEEGETPLQAVIRETQEELGIKVEPGELLYIGEFTDKPLENYEVTRHIFLWKMSVNIDEIDLQEGKGMKFIKASEGKSIMETPADRKIAEKVKETLSKLA